MATNDTLGAFNSGTDYAAEKAKSCIDYASSAIKDAARESGHLADDGWMASIDALFRPAQCE